MKKDRKWKEAVSGGMARLARHRKSLGPTRPNTNGISRSETGSLTLPVDYSPPRTVESAENSGRVVIVITILSIIFIAIIAWFVANEPASNAPAEKDKSAQTGK
ncbi:MAG: hypothetical protein AB1631_07450 [Acidobacteriota bacterium]